MTDQVHKPLSKQTEELATEIVDAAIQVHRLLAQDYLNQFIKHASVTNYQYEKYHFKKKLSCQ